VPDYYSSCVWVLLGDGNGTFKPAVAYATDWFPQSIVVADFNGDGLPDIAMGSDSGLTSPWRSATGTARSERAPTTIKATGSAKPPRISTAMATRT